MLKDFQDLILSIPLGIAMLVAVTYIEPNMPWYMPFLLGTIAYWVVVILRSKQ